MDLMRLYWHLPVSFQEFALSSYSVVLQQRYYGRGYQEFCRALDGQESWSPGQIADFQLVSLRYIVGVAAERVPYYRSAFKAAGVGHKSLHTCEDLARFPFLEKQVVRRDSRALVDERRQIQSLVSHRTSGSTGTPLVMFWPREMFPKWWALHERRVRAWAGVSQAMPRAMVGGRPIVPGKSKGPYWRYNYLWHQLYLSSYHISPSTAPGYIGAMRRRGSEWVTGYGSAIALLGEWLRNHPVDDFQAKAVLTSGDNLLPAHRQAIEEGFGCRVFDYYGSTEGCLVISECEHGRFHVQPESGVLEIINESGGACRPGEVGEMVITGLLNDAMPLIRYRIGDLAAWSTETECLCGRQSPLVSHIEGRGDDYLLMVDGRRIGRLSTAIKKALTIRSAQIVQDATDHAWLLLQPGADYRHEHAQVIVADILSRIGSFDIDVHEVDCLPKTRTGKQRLVVRLVDHQEIAELYLAQLPRVPWRC